MVDDEQEAADELDGALDRDPAAIRPESARLGEAALRARVDDLQNENISLRTRLFEGERLRDLYLKSWRSAEGELARYAERLHKSTRWRRTFRNRLATVEQQERTVRESLSFRLGHFLVRTVKLDFLRAAFESSRRRKKRRRKKAKKKQAAAAARIEQTAIPSTTPDAGILSPELLEAFRSRSPAAPSESPRAALVRENCWTDIPVPEIGAWTPVRKVSVVIPYYEAQRELEITLAALAKQTYPAELTQIVVADDGSKSAPVIPGHCPFADALVVRQERREFGLARARNTGAAAADGEILLFLDCDMVPEPQWVEAHARWHHTVGDGVTLGFRRHVDFDDIDPSAITRALDGSGLDQLFENRPQQAPGWIDYRMRRTGALTSSADDHFSVLTGGNMGVRAETFSRVGGFDESFEQWGAEDTELGYRLFTDGCLFIPERRAHCWHQGLSDQDVWGPDESEQRSLLEQRAKLAHLIADPSSRTQLPGRSFKVPYIVVHIDADGEPYEELMKLVQSVLASAFHDLVVCLSVPDYHPERTRLTRQWKDDPRVRVGAAVDDHSVFPFAALRMRIRPEVILARESIGILRNTLRTEHIGVLQVTANTAIDPLIELIKTRALRRAQRLAPDRGSATRIAAELFGGYEMPAKEARIGLAKEIATGATRIDETRNRRCRVDLKVQTPDPDTFGFGGCDVAKLNTGIGSDTADVIVLDMARILESGTLESIRAKTTPTPVVCLACTAPPEPAPSADCVELPVPVDISVHNPIGFHRTPDLQFAAVVGPGNDPMRAASTIHEIGLDRLVDVYSRSGSILTDALSRVSQELPDDATQGAMLEKYRAVLDSRSFHSDSFQRAEFIVQLSCRGTPVILLDTADGLPELLGQNLADALTAFSVDSTSDSTERERLSVAMRRAALRHHSPPGFWRRLATLVQVERAAALPTVSITLATRRRRYLKRVIESINRQSYGPLEVVLALHGDHFPKDFEAQLRRLCNRHLEIVHVGAQKTLGDALNMAADAASGEYLTKMDDDDWYGPEHIWDLMLAAQYSGADLVGKGAEFIYLANADRTVRRVIGSPEAYDVNLAGGTLLFEKPTLRSVGGWQPMQGTVDRDLIDDLLMQEAQVFRTHGFGYVLNRHGIDHTWREAEKYFWTKVVDKKPGLDLVFSGIE